MAPRDTTGTARPSRARRAPSAKKLPLTARTADRHDLYQRSVQAPDYEIRFVDKVFKAHTGRRPLHLREDFCGTALLCSKWAKSHPERTALGLDVDRPTLDWGIARNLAAVGEAAARVTLLEQDVLVPTRRKVEVIGAYNYSYQVFHERAVLKRYFEAARRSLSDDGLFVLDSIGGWESQQVLTEKRAVDGGFTYVWEQAEFDPISSHFVCHISFEFRDGSRLRRAFTYDWRLWTLAELRDLLLEAGFVGVDAYWEGEDAEGAGSGTFHRVARATNDPGWNAYLVARKSAPLPGSPDATRAARGGARRGASVVP
jgi:SAM-dependent methyltransferase